MSIDDGFFNIMLLLDIQTKILNMPSLKLLFERQFRKLLSFVKALNSKDFHLILLLF